MISIALAAALVVAQSGPVTIVGPGGDSCGQWLEARRRRDVSEAIYGAWLGGYISAANQAGLGDVLGGRRVADAQLWIDGYCRAHPFESIKRAADALLLSLDQ